MEITLFEAKCDEIKQLEKLEESLATNITNADLDSKSIRDDRLKLWESLKDIENEAIQTTDKLWNNEQKLKQDKEDIEKKVAVIKDSCHQLMSEMDSYEQLLSLVTKEAGDARDAEMQVTQKALLRDRRDLSVVDLLKQITQIHWDPPKGTETISGTIVSPTDIKPFTYSLKETPKQQILTELWSLLDEGRKFNA